MIKFICGCTSKLESNWVVTPTELDELAEVGVFSLEEAYARYLSTFDSVSVDDDGFLICAIHHQRRYGWASVPYQATKLPEGIPANCTPLEYEQWLYKGILPVRRSHVVSSKAEDRRFNDDPLEFFRVRHIPVAYYPPVREPEADAPGKGSALLERGRGV